MSSIQNHLLLLALLSHCVLTLCLFLLYRQCRRVHPPSPRFPLHSHRRALRSATPLHLTPPAPSSPPSPLLPSSPPPPASNHTVAPETRAVRLYPPPRRPRCPNANATLRNAALRCRHRWSAGPWPPFPLLLAALTRVITMDMAWRALPHPRRRLRDRRVREMWRRSVRRCPALPPTGLETMLSGDSVRRL